MKYFLKVFLLLSFYQSIFTSEQGYQNCRATIIELQNNLKQTLEQLLLWQNNSQEKDTIILQQQQIINNLRMQLTNIMDSYNQLRGEFNRPRPGDQADDQDL